MIVSKYLFKYIYEINPKFNDIELNHRMIQQKYKKIIEGDNHLNNIWLYFLINKIQCCLEAKKNSVFIIQFLKKL